MRNTRLRRKHAKQGLRRPGLGRAFGILLVLACPTLLFAATFTATLDRNPIRLGDRAMLSLTFDGGTPDREPALPSIPNLQVAYVGPSSQFSVINGQVSSSVTYNYTLVPQKIGDFNIPSISAVVGGQRYATQPIKLAVVQPNVPPTPVAGSDAEPAFLRLELPKQELYVGETVVGELQLFLSDKVQNAGNFRVTALPADGFTVRSSSSQGQRQMVRVGNSTYSEIPFELALTPVKTGPLTIGPVTVSLVIELPSANRRRDPLWDPFGLMNATEQRDVTLAAPADTLKVLPLPSEGAPPNFNGAIGSYSLSVTAGPTNVTVGDPITVKIQIAGSGSLDALAVPDQPAWRNFKIYPSAPKLEATDSLGVHGTKTFEEVLVPQTSDIKELPALSFSYFDVETRSYRSLTGPTFALSVRPGGATPQPVVAANRGGQESTPPAQDIVSIKQRAGDLGVISPPLLEQPWFLSLQSVPALALVGAVIWRKRNDRFANNPRLRRRRQVARRLREGRSELRKFAAESNSDEFFATLVRLLQEQLGERLDLQASAITEAIIEERLRPAGVSEQTQEALRDLFQMCNLARYAPIKTSQELAALIPKAESVLRDLQELK